MSPDPSTDAAPVAGALTWTIIVPLKAMPQAKSRLLPASSSPEAHAELVEAIRADTLAAAVQAGSVLLVFDRPPVQTFAWPSLVQTEPGLNAALREAAALVAQRRPTDAVAALVGDLPALTGAELTAALTQAARYPRAFVADAAGTGTTLLAARPGVSLDPAFGLGSAARHAQVAHRLEAGPGLRLDVDTATDLTQAQVLGLGPATRTQLTG